MLATTTALAAVAAGTGLALANTGSSHGAPVFAAAPTRPPVTTRTDGGPCVTHQTEHTGSAEGLVWVQPDPTGAVTIWVPGLNSRACEARRVVSGKAVAIRLAEGIDHSSKVSGDEYACPADDASRVSIYLTYAGGRDEQVDVSLTGCRWLEAPRRGARWIDNEVSETLRAIAPPPWRQYN
jgi:hypothetical protein